MPRLLALLAAALAASAAPCLVHSIEYRSPFRLLPPGVKDRAAAALALRPGSPWQEQDKGQLARAVRDALAGAGDGFAITAVTISATPCDSGQTDLVVYLFTTRLLAGSPRFQLNPSLRLDRGERFAGGGALRLVPSPRFGLHLNGSGGPGFLDAGFATGGTARQFSYAAGLRHRNEPLGADTLRSGYGYGWFQGAKDALRYGLQYEQGYQLAERYRGAKGLLAFTAGDFTFAGGYQYGDATAGTYRKAVFDSSYAHRLRVADHRFLSFDARLNGGWLPSATAPPGERFFGGMRDRHFSEIPGIELRAAPRLRSFGSNQFRLAPAGRERFVATNVTVALTTWRLPLLPREVTSSPDFIDQIEAGKGTITGALESYHESRDPLMKQIKPLAESLLPLLEPLLTNPDELCAESADRLDGTVRKAIETSVYASLPRALPDCGSQPRLETVLAEIKQSLTRLDRKAIERRAAQDSRSALRALDVLTRELNLFSIDPLFVFDHAVLDNRRQSLTRSSIGGGLRFSIASTLGFEIGYAFTPNRSPGESAGALFFGLRITDLFR